MLFLLHSKHDCGCVTNMYHLILFREIIIVCCENLSVLAHFLILKDKWRHVRSPCYLCDSASPNIARQRLIKHFRAAMNIHAT
jgi:hypothetical protein